jgi:hypothetical protein
MNISLIFAWWVFWCICTIFSSCEGHSKINGNTGVKLKRVVQFYFTLHAFNKYLFMYLFIFYLKMLSIPQNFFCNDSSVQSPAFLNVHCHTSGTCLTISRISPCYVPDCLPYNHCNLFPHLKSDAS